MKRLCVIGCITILLVLLTSCGGEAAETTPPDVPPTADTPTSASPTDPQTAEMPDNDPDPADDPTELPTVQIEPIETETPATETQTDQVSPEETDTTATAPAEEPGNDPVSTNVESSVLDRVMERGILRCGYNGELPGFGFREPDGTFTGFDVDFCRVIATAVLGDPEAVEFVKADADNRFRLLAQNDIDVLIRNTTWTAVRDVGLDDPEMGTISFDFGPIIFHDGQRFMVPNTMTVAGTDTVVSEIQQLNGMRICAIDGTTSVLNLADQFTARNIDYEPVIRGSADEVFAAYEAGDCDAVTSDTSQLVSRRALLTNPENHTIILEPISREPLAPVVVENDSEWLDVVTWAIHATIYAEELGVDSDNASQLRNVRNPAIRRLLGTQGSIGLELGLSNDFALQIIQEVGNYGEIYNRNLGPDTPYALDRGPNKVWNKGEGGVLSSPPFR